MTYKHHIQKVRLQDRTAPCRGPQAVSRAAHDDFWYHRRVDGQTSGGVVVTEETSMTYATVWACVNKLSKTIATLPAHVKEHTGEDTTRNAPEQVFNTLWRVKPNIEQTAVQFREASMANLLLWGNTFIHTRRTVAGTLHDMWLLQSRYMTVDRDQSNNLVYDYREPGKPLRTFRADDILHIGGLSFDGTMGLSVIGFHRQSVGVGLGATTHVNSFLDQGAQPGIVIQRPVEAPELTPEAEDRVLSSFDNRHSGSTKAWRTALLQEGMTLETVSMPLKDMEFIALRRFQKGDIAGIFDVPLTKIHENERDTFSNVEQKNIDWKTDSILPWCVRIENAVDAKFFVDTPFFLKHNMDGLARGDLASRSEYYTAGRMGGWLSVNDIRELEDMNPIDDGDIYLSPLNMIPASQAEMVEATPTESSTAVAKATDIHGPFRRLATEAAQRCVTKEVKAVGNAWKKHAKAGTVDDFLSWADKFYDGHGEYLYSTMLPVLVEWATVAGCGTPAIAGTCVVSCNHDNLIAVVKSSPESVPKFLDDINETFAASLVADIESRITEGV